MATYIDGEENFPDDENGRFIPHFGIGGMCIAFEKCPLCFTARRPFTCERCLENGDFSHSSSKSSTESETDPHPEERYCEKLDRLLRLRSERDRLLSKLANRLKERNSVADKQWEVSLMKGRLEWTRMAIQDERIMMEKDKQSLIKHLDELRAVKAKREEHNKKVLKIQKYLEHIRTNIDSRKESLEEKNEQLRTKRQAKVEQLLHYVFPITEIQHTSPREESWQEEVRQMSESEADEKSSEDELVAALAEARRTSYVRGRWVETINNGEAHYSIVHPYVRVPANGDYSAYIACTLTGETDVPDPDAELDLQNPGHQVSAALCYTAQLIAHLANTLDVPLVRKVHFSRFCKSELSLREFSSAVEKLNSSVLFLCFSQAIPPDKLHPHYTLRNLITMVDSKHQHYGRTGDFEIHSDLLLATLTTPNMTSMLSGSGSESQQDSPDDDGASIGSADQEEWETVPTTLPLLPQACGGVSEEGNTPSPPEPSPSMMSASNLPQAPGGLVSSAVASVASLWRTATSQLEKR
ncbi:beclin 1-associated autophagy-related key regulator-like [Lytechinus pictus]|uniref:beclin 1-associated autophagy-related key regulator-like n=1 Tax=Lytechinus pictus TaxID=7653 RepID=UPI0030B9F5C0